MNDDYQKAYEDFRSHFSELSDRNLKIYADKAKKYLNYIEKKAKKYNVSPNYYILEFM